MLNTEITAGAELVQELVDANHILHHLSIVDAFGHVSVRHDRDPARFLLARNLAPVRVRAADILEYAVATGEPLAADPPRLYLERYIHSEIYRARPDVMAVVHNHSPAVLPFCVARGARLKPVCHMAGFLGGASARDGPALFEIRNHAGNASDLLIRSQALGAALARTLSDGRVVLMRGHGCTVVADTLRVAVFRAVYTEVNAKLMLQSLPLGALEFLTPEEADATRITNEGQAARAWDLWREQAQRADQDQ